MGRKYYPLWLRLDALDRHAIWYSGDHGDGLIIGDEGLIVSFADIMPLHHYAQEQGFVLEEEELILHDLDALKPWLLHPRKADVDCGTFLTAWNLFSDVALSLGETYDSDQARTKKIYNKLFWGSNLPAVTPANSRYTPIWTKSEVGLMHYALNQGLRLVRNHLAKTDNRKFAKTNLAEDMQKC